MRILIVTPDLQYPPARGYQVMACQHIEKLAACHTIDLVTFGDGSARFPGIDTMRRLCKSVKVIPLPKWRSLLNMSFGLMTDDPLQVRFYRSKRMADAIEERLRNTSYDVVIFQMTRMAQYLPRWYRGSAVLNMVDPLVFNYERSLNWRPWYIRTALRLEIKRLKRYEAQQATRFDRVLLNAPADVLDYQGLLKSSCIELAPYGIDVDYFKPDVTRRQPGMIVMSGSMFYAPNADAVIYFCRDIFPLILEQEPTAHLWLVGARPSSEIKRLAKGKNITVTGYVDDIRPYLNRATVSVCPIRLNVGTQTKVLEALAMETPVVTTSGGNHGICADSGTCLYVADTPLEFADRVVSLLRGHRWKELSENGRRFVSDHFRWEISAAKLEIILGALASQTRRTKD